MATLTLQSSVAYAPLHDFSVIADKIMGKRYEVTTTFIGPKRAKQLNEAYRQKDYVPNVLSFPLTENIGEIYICPQVAKKEAKNFNLTPDGYITYLFIHGLLHLKGLDHGDTMDTQEKKYLKLFQVT